MNECVRFLAFVCNRRFEFSKMVTTAGNFGRAQVDFERFALALAYRHCFRKYNVEDMCCCPFSLAQKRTQNSHLQVESVESWPRQPTHTKYMQEFLFHKPSSILFWSTFYYSIRDFVCLVTLLWRAERQNCERKGIHFFCCFRVLCIWKWFLCSICVLLLSLLLLLPLHVVFVPCESNECSYII